MSSRTLQYEWHWTLKSPPAALWPFVADTNRFNRDVGLPVIERQNGPAPRQPNARRRLRLKLFGMPLEWDEEPFEWIWPSRYAVLRRYHSGPVAEVRAQIDLEPTDAGGTHLTFRAAATPRNFLGRLIIPIQVGLRSHRAMKRIYPRYDNLARTGDMFSAADAADIRFAPGGRERLASLSELLLERGGDPAISRNLINTIESANEFSLASLRPYALADHWKLDRRAVLETFLLATRIGILEFQWNILCPSCRGPQQAALSLEDVPAAAHCETCNIDFNVNFERSTELIFRPVPAIRPIETREFCMGGPQLRPHVIAQKLLKPTEDWTVTPTLEPGRYRLRTLEQLGGQHLQVSPHNPTAPSPHLLTATDSGWPSTELPLSTTPTLIFQNASSAEQLFFLERMAWTDQAATAADVIVLQKFRDLFDTEALRPGQQISVGSIAILFTDLRASTELYRTIGDAPAFGRVMSHFDILKAAITAEGGSMVKTIGDAVMAVFHQPIQALRAVGKAQKALRESTSPLHLKAGLHYGPAIAVTLNDRLDYFGTTINIAARLVDLSTGQDVVVSRAIYDDSLVQKHLDESRDVVHSTAFEGNLKGHAEMFTLWRIAP